MIDQRRICAHIRAALPMRARPVGPTDESWSLWSADPLCLPARFPLTGSYMDESTDANLLLSRTGGMVIQTKVHGDAAVYVLAPDNVVPGALTRLAEHVTPSTVAAVATNSNGFAAVCFCLRGDGNITFWQHVASRLAHKALGLFQVDPSVSEVARSEVARSEPAKAEPAVAWRDRVWVVAEPVPAES
jgi:hypothetical protein